MDIDSRDGSPDDGSLLDRDAETVAIGATVRRLTDGHSGLIVIEGRAGVGKTALLDRVVRAGRAADATVLTASGSPSESRVPLGLGSQLFGATALPRASRVPTGGQWPTETAARSSLKLYRRLLRMARADPLVIAVDDLHLLDELSLQWLIQLSRRLRALPAVLAVTVPRGDLSPGPGAELITELSNHLDAVRLHPGPLSAAGVAGLLARYLDRPVPEAFAGVCHAATGGNPLLLTEMCHLLRQESVDPETADLDALAEIGPPAVARYTLDRLRRSSPTAPRVARAAATLGSASRLTVIAAMCAMEDDAVRDDAILLRELGVLRSTPPAGFVHPMVRNALYATMPSSERERYHQGAATALSGEDGDATEIGRHLLAVPPTTDPSTVEMLCRVAVSLIASGEHALGAECMQRAMQGAISPTHRGLLALTLGRSLATHDPSKAIAHLRHASSAVRQPEQIHMAQRTLAHVLATQGQIVEAVDVVNLCADQLATERPEMAVQTREAARLLSMLHADTVGAATESLAEPGDATIRRVGLSGALHQLAVAVRNSWSGVRRVETVERLQRIITDGSLPATCPTEYSAAVLTLVQADRADLAERYLEQLDDTDTSYASDRAVLRSVVAMAKGEIGHAVTEARCAVHAVETGGQPLLADHYAVLIHALSEAGERDEVAAILGRTGVARSLPKLWRHNHLLEVRGRLRVDGGETHAGLADLLECGRRLRHWAIDNPAVNGWRSATALALYRIGRKDGARALADAQVEAAHRWGTHRAIGTSLHARALLEDADADRITRLTEAVTHLRESMGVLELARALVDLGATMIDAQQPHPARELLREALDIAQRCGAVELAERSHRQLLRSGARPRRRAESGLAALTSAELRTATMAAQGHTNRQIAQKLFVTQRTIELHLTNAYRKLQVHNRAELGAVLERGDASAAEQPAATDTDGAGPDPALGGVRAGAGTLPR